ncbi:unnamed protein product [Haemonchus placei]|uniref:Ovule protein n=1 Tax=Haemonchus placei TaxID=6290 RepID=A0A0N4X1M5_HAEPC|nr:unnamed protein product [Haemonchus placei]
MYSMGKTHRQPQQHQTAFLQLMRQHQPHFVLLSLPHEPLCRHRSSLFRQHRFPPVSHCVSFCCKYKDKPEFNRKIV